jgi:hypothetical protein
MNRLFLTRPFGYQRATRSSAPTAPGGGSAYGQPSPGLRLLAGRDQAGFCASPISAPAVSGERCVRRRSPSGGAWWLQKCMRPQSGTSGTGRGVTPPPSQGRGGDRCLAGWETIQVLPWKHRSTTVWADPNEGHDGQEDPAGIETGVWDKMAEDDRDE